MPSRLSNTHHYTIVIVQFLVIYTIIFKKRKRVGCDYHSQSSALNFEKKIFSLEMVKNDTCFRGASKQNVFSLEDVP